MKRLLITGFEPFGGESVNPSWEAVLRLPDVIGDYEISKLRAPVVFGGGADAILDEASRILPDVIISVGQAGGRDAITPEMVAINLRYASIPDNSGNQPKDEPIVRSGESAYFSTLPVRKMVEASVSLGISARVSYSAGAYVCNDVLYTLLHRYRGTDVRVGFIHVPFSKEQGKDPSMDIADTVRGLSAMIEAL